MFVPADVLTVVQGRWVELETLGAGNAGEIQHLDRRRDLLPQMGGPILRQLPGDSFGAPLAVRARATGRLIGVAANQPLTEYPGVTAVSFYVDQAEVRPGLALEAAMLYAQYVLTQGAEVLHSEVLEFNRAALRLLSRAGIRPQARLRRHLYVAGEFWDVLVFSLHRSDWEPLQAAFAGILPAPASPTSS